MNFSFVQLAKELDSAKAAGVSVAGKSQNWDSEEKVKELVEQIDKCTDLQYLDLEGNTLGVDAAKAIGKALEKHPEFKQALWKDLFTGRLKTEIPQALKHLGKGLQTAGAQLTVLDCSDNALGPNGMVGLEDLIRSPTCYSLKELKLNNCGLGITGGKMLAKALLDCHAASTKAGTPLALRVFIAGRNRLENEGAKALGKVFETLGSLEEVAMPQNGIYHEGISALSQGFRQNANMRILNLNDNTIRAKGAAALGEAFYFMKNLKEINFGDCLLKTRGAMLIADALQDEHEELEVINLGFNEIGPDGGMAIAAALQNKNNIQSVILGGNQFGYEGRERVKELMEDTANVDALGSLSEDESADEEEDEDAESASGEEEEDDDEEEEEEYDEDVDSAAEGEEDLEGINYVTCINNQTLNSTVDGELFVSPNSSVVFAGESARPNTIETFCNTPNPSLEMFDSLEESNKLDAFRSYINSYKDEEYLLLTVFTALKCAALSLGSKDALDVAQHLFADAFELAEKTQQKTRVKNFFLIQLGLLKCEDKAFKPVYDLDACRSAMKKAIETRNVPEHVKTTFNVFLERCA